MNKSCIINSQHLHSYSNGAECTIIMNGCNEEIEVSRRKKTDILLLLREN
ncbi:MAG: hypothetical protein H0X46_00495 [Bacteroidetes bacterium]|nr:hypothetical protein [Bacteroidota bacterium]